MAAGTGIAAVSGFSKEVTPNTRVAPSVFIPFVQESLTCDQQFIRSAGKGSGTRYRFRKGAGQREVGGSISYELQSETIIELLELCLGGSAATTGSSSPWTHVFEGGDLDTATVQVARPSADGTINTFDYIGSKVNQWTLSQNPNEFAMLQVEYYSYDEVLDEDAATFAPDASPTLLTFANLTVNTVDGDDVCFDSITLTGSNTLERSYKSCADDQGRATIRESGYRTLTGTLSGDFIDMDAYATYLAGTEGSLQIEWDAGASAKVTLDLNVFYTGTTPVVDGEGVVTQAVEFEVIVGEGNDDTDAITVTVVSTDENA